MDKSEDEILAKVLAPYVAYRLLFRAGKLLAVYLKEQPPEGTGSPTEEAPKNK